MYKEIIISISIIILVIIGDIITQNYTKKTVNLLTDKLEILKKELQSNQLENLYKQIDEINLEIEKVHSKLAYYLEHDELEKAETSFTSCKSYVNSKNFVLAIEETEKTIFVLNHITDKYSFNLENIF